MGKPGGEHSPAKIALRIRRQEAMRLRVAGATYQAIADTLLEAAADPENANQGLVVPERYGRQEALRDVRAACKESTGDLPKLADEYRATQLERHRTYIEALHLQAEKGNLAAIASIQSLEKDDRDLLPPLTVTRKVALTDPSGEKQFTGGVVVYIPDNGRDDSDTAAEGATGELPSD